MKKLTFSFLILFVSMVSFAQKTKSSGNNEIRFNVPYAIYGLPELTYERILQENMGVGLSLAIAVDKPYDWLTDKGVTERMIICPYYRLYFSEKKKAAGFYVEGNMGLASQKATEYYYLYDPLTGIYTENYETKSSFGFGFGAAIGFKLLTKNNFFGDFHGGWGRLFGDNVYNSYPRLGVCIGKRF